MEVCRRCWIVASDDARTLLRRGWLQLSLSRLSTLNDEQGKPFSPRAPANEDIHPCETLEGVLLSRFNAVWPLTCRHVILCTFSRVL